MCGILQVVQCSSYGARWRRVSGEVLRLQSLLTGDVLIGIQFATLRGVGRWKRRRCLVSSFVMVSCEVYIVLTM